MDELLHLYELLKKQHPYVSSDWWPTYTDNPEFEVMIGCVLTQNTKWGNVEKCINELINHCLTTPEAIINADFSELKRCLKSSGYYNQKAERLKTLARFVKEKTMERMKKERAKWLE